MWQQLPFCSCQSTQTQVLVHIPVPDSPLASFHSDRGPVSRLPSPLSRICTPTAFMQHNKWERACEPAPSRGREHSCPCKEWKAGVCEPVRKRFPSAVMHKAPAEHPRPRAGSAPTWSREPPASLEAVQAQNRVSQRSLWFCLAPKSVLAFSKPGTPSGFEIRDAH